MKWLSIRERLEGSLGKGFWTKASQYEDMDFPYRKKLAGNKGRKYCFYNSSHEIRCKAIQSLHLTLEQTLQELLNSLITSYFCPHMLNYNLRWCSQDWKYYFLMGFSVQFCRVKWFRLHIGTQPAQTQFLKIGHSEVKYLGNSLRRCKQLLYFL